MGIEGKDLPTVNSIRKNALTAESSEEGVWRLAGHVLSKYRRFNDESPTAAAVLFTEPVKRADTFEETAIESDRSLQDGIVFDVGAFGQSKYGSTVGNRGIWCFLCETGKNRFL